MDPTSGGGWLQLLDNGTLDGEFMGVLGRFSAKRTSGRAKIGNGPTRGRRIHLG